MLPDTAVAKSAVGRVDDALRRLGSSTASSLTLGAGLSALWAVSAASAAHAAWTGRRGALALVAANAVIVVLFLGVAVRGQEVAGFRNVMWALLFMASWNIASSPQTVQIPERVRTALSLRGVAGKVVMLGALGLLAAAWAVEGHLVKRIVDDRSGAYADMRSQKLDRLADLPGVAFDIGFVGYFTEGAICDLNGLVNGPEAARLSEDERAAALCRAVPCVRIRHAFASRICAEVRGHEHVGRLPQVRVHESTCSRAPLSDRRAASGRTDMPAACVYLRRGRSGLARRANLAVDVARGGT